MIRRTVLFAPVALAVAGCAGSPRTALTADERRNLRVAEVRTVTTAAVFDGAGAEERRNFVGPDLSAELRDEFRDRLADQGWTLEAEIALLSVVGATATSFGRDRSALEGTLRLIDPAGTVRASAPITVTAGAARESLGGRIVGAASTAATGGGRGRFYRTLLDQFARDGRTLLLGADLPGERLVRRVATAGG